MGVGQKALPIKPERVACRRACLCVGDKTPHSFIRTGPPAALKYNATGGKKLGLQKKFLRLLEGGFISFSLTFCPSGGKKLKAGKMSCLLKGECVFTEAHKPWVALNVVALRYTIGLLCFKGFGHPSRPTPQPAVHSSKHRLSHCIQMLDNRVHIFDTTFWLARCKGETFPREIPMCPPKGF